MGGFSWLARRPAAAGDPTHALFAAQSHSIVDNLVALFEYSRAWNCSSDILGCLRRDQDAGPGSLTRRRQLSMHFCRVVAKSPRSPEPESRIQWPNVIGTASLVIMTNGRHLGHNPRTGALPFLMLKADVASLSMILFGDATIGHFQ